MKFIKTYETINMNDGSLLNKIFLKKYNPSLEDVLNYMNKKGYELINIYGNQLIFRKKGKNND